MAALATAQLRVKELEGQLAAARDELEQERAGQSDEREQLQVRGWAASWARAWKC